MIDKEILEKMYTYWLSNFEDTKGITAYSNLSPQRAIEYGYVKAINMCRFVLEHITQEEYIRQTKYFTELAICYGVLKE